MKARKSSDLKPCPFCGSKNVEVRNWPTGWGCYDRWKYAVGCLNCQADGPLVRFAVIAALKWNKRQKT